MTSETKDVEHLKEAWCAFKKAQKEFVYAPGGMEERRLAHIEFTLARVNVLKTLGDFLEEPIDEASLLSQ